MPESEAMEIEETVEGTERGEDGTDNEDEESSASRPSNVTRAVLIEQLNREIVERQVQMRKLVREHRNHVEKARMLLDARDEYKRWNDGAPRYASSRDRKRSKVLLALQSDFVPVCMTWRYPYHFFNAKLNNDREILLARLQLDDFAATYAGRAFEVPSKFRKDKEVMMIVCSKSSETLRFASKMLKVRSFFVV